MSGTHKYQAFQYWMFVLSAKIYMHVYHKKMNVSGLGFFVHMLYIKIFDLFSRTLKDYCQEEFAVLTCIVLIKTFTPFIFRFSLNRYLFLSFFNDFFRCSSLGFSLLFSSLSSLSSIWKQIHMYRQTKPISGFFK